MGKRNVVLKALLLIFVIFNLSFSHYEWVHQHQVKQAYLLLKNQIGMDIPILKDRMGMDASGEGTGTWIDGKVVIGAWREDIDDPVWGIGGGGNIITGAVDAVSCGFTASSTHFWNADAGDDATIDIPLDLNACSWGDGDIPNAYTKARYYRFGNWWLALPVSPYIRGQLRNGDWVKITPIVPPGPLLFIATNLANIYNTKELYFYYYGCQMYNETRGKDIAYTGPIKFDDNTINRVVWEVVGRICHLLGDMTVPAHVHNDVHPCDATFITVNVKNGDSYEMWMGGTTEWTCTSPGISVPAYSWTWQDALNQGGFINVTSKENPLRYLFYSTNQIADHFGSYAIRDAPAFDPPRWRPGDNMVYSTNGSDTYNELLNIINTLGTPVTNQIDFEASKTTTSENAFVFGIRAIAGFLHWFSISTGLLNGINVQNDFGTGKVIVGLDNMYGGALKEYQSGVAITAPNGTGITLKSISPQYDGKTHQRYFKDWQKLITTNWSNVTTYNQDTWSTVIDGNNTYSARFNKLDNVNITAPKFLESGSGGYYNITSDAGTNNNVTVWNGTYLEYVNNPINIEAFPPPGYIFACWSDGETANPRNLSPTDHVEDLSAIYKLPLHSTSSTATGKNS